MTRATTALSSDVLNGFEDAVSDFDSLGAVVRAVIEALGPDGGAEVHRLLQAAERGYAERRAAAEAA